MNTTEVIVRESSSPPFSRVFGSIPFLLVSSSVLVSLTSSMVLLLSFILQGLKVDTPLLAAAFALTFAVYNLDRVLNRKEDLINDPNRSRLFTGRERMWGVLAMASLAWSVAVGAAEGPGVLLTLLSPLGVYAAYSVGLPSGPRLKQIPVVKNVVLVGTWALVPTLLPSLRAIGPAGEKGALLSLLIFYFIFAKIMVNSILFDLRDVKGDSASSVRTLPVILGMLPVRRLLILINATLVVWTAVCWLLGSFTRYLPILAASIVYGFWYIDFFTKGKRERILVDLLVDGEWIPLALATALVYLLT